MPNPTPPPDQPPHAAPTAGRMPVAFVSHGAPTLALDRVAGADFARLFAALPRPRAILALSAHWLDAPPTIGTVTARPLLHDYAGFPPALGRVRHDAPTAAWLAPRLAELLPGVARADARPWDHGVWVPLVHMDPRAEIPVLQLSVPWRWSPRELHALGRALRPLRDDGVLVLASGGMVHNLGALAWSGDAPPPAWALDFEGWVSDRLLARDDDGLLAYRERAPGFRQAHPSDDHFVSLLVAAGAADAGDAASFPITGFELGSLSRCAVRFG
jgi:4,5-DOPA dioxygenase extradiol